MRSYYTPRIGRKKLNGNVIVNASFKIRWKLKILHSKKAIKNSRIKLLCKLRNILSFVEESWSFYCVCLNTRKGLHKNKEKWLKVKSLCKSKDKNSFKFSVHLFYLGKTNKDIRVQFNAKQSSISKLLSHP